MQTFRASLPSKFVVGILALTSGQKKQLTEATWYGTASSSTPPNDCRGYWIRIRSGTVRIGNEPTKTAGEGFTLTATSEPLHDDVASGVGGVYASEAAAGNATIEILCRTGGPA
jgi:hypothetical protein